MTYQELLNKIQKFTPEQLEQDVTTYDTYDEEFYPIRYLEYDKLDKNYPYLAF